MFRQLLSMFKPSYPTVLVYMLQSTEYEVGPYLTWLRRTKDFSQVTKRRTLDHTKPARLLLLALRVGIALQIAVGMLLIVLGATDHLAGGVAFGVAVIIAYPLLWPYLLVIPLVLGRVLVSGPATRQRIVVSEQIFARHPGIKIAVAGSYAKTTMKEMLLTVLSEGLNVAATPANKNVSSSHALFAAKLAGDEDVLVLEYGEGEPGDVARFAQLTHPTHAIITGLAPAHLDKYKTLTAAGEDIFSVATYLHDTNVFVNGDSPAVKPFVKPAFAIFDGKQALGWKVSSVQVELTGTTVTLTKASKTITVHSQLLGRHHVGFIAFVAALGLQLGLTEKQVIAGLAKTKPFEHRMQPYKLGGAWVIDDTYNGNLEGIKAGTSLLHELDATRKIYVTPGLVEQGAETETVHVEVGELIAAAQPDLVVLMKNTVTDYIERGLKAKHYQGELQIVDEPLEFYTNLKHFVAHGDLVVMQNDWTDNYA